MSGRFVSGGTIAPSGEVSSSEPQQAQAKPGQDDKNKEWEAVRQKLEAEQKQREEQRVKAAAGGEKSLYDILQENKAAKQAAFEEQNKLRNQFRALDDDEVGFLDEVREKQRQEEERVRRETEAGLKAFRERQKSGAAAPPEAGPDAVDGPDETAESWGVGKKRKRAKDKELKGVRRRTSEGEKKGGEPAEREPPQPKPAQEAATASTTGTAKKGLALVGYGSDSDDD